MKTAGIDIGSRTIKLAVLEKGSVAVSRKCISSHNPLETARELMNDMGPVPVAATGYGRHFIKANLGSGAKCAVISEIKAFALGARLLSSDCRAVLDIGGQDTKAISLDGNGNMIKFEMNDKCATGTGRFFEIMAAALGYTLDNFREQRCRPTVQRRSTAPVRSLPNQRLSH